jgi:hypothetical protein
MARLAQVERRLADARRLGGRPAAADDGGTRRCQGPRRAAGAGRPLRRAGAAPRFFVVDCASLEEAIATARDLAAANPGSGAYEIRPVAIFRPGAVPA